MPRKKESVYETEQYAFPSRLRELMKDTGTKQKDLAQALGVKPQTVSLYTQGQSFPDVNNLAKIALFFDVSADWLIGIPGSIMDTNPDAQIAGKYTGLNDAAIKWLNGKNSDNMYLMGMINRLFEIDGLADILFHSMFEYCISRFTTVTLHDSLLDTSEDKSFSESGKILKFFAQEQYSSVLDDLRSSYADYIDSLMDAKIDTYRKAIEHQEQEKKVLSNLDKEGE